MIFKSRLEEYMHMLVSHKRAIGKQYIAEEKYLKKFDEMIFEFFPDCMTVTKEAADKWGEKRSYEKVATQRHRITPIKDLAILMNSLGKSAYVYPMHTLNKEARYSAHIYTQKEISAFFKQVDSCSYSPKVPYRHIVMPILFRILYCCGLRPGEVTRLTVGDVDLENGILSIIDSKYGNDRLVPMNDELTKMCRKYADEAHILTDNNAPFFLGYKNSIITSDNLNSNFRRFLRKAGISHGGSGKGPRIYDFRHTFAVNTLKNMVMSGKDMNAYYPVLKTYMGHSFFKYTEYYLQLTKDVFPEIADKIEILYSDIITDKIGEDSI